MVSETCGRQRGGTGLKSQEERGAGGKESNEPCDFRGDLGEI